MARIRRAPTQQRTALAGYLVRRADEEKRRHPEKSYAQIGRELGIRQKDPARLIRKLRTGETSGRYTVPELLGKPSRREPVPRLLQGRFSVAYQWWYTEGPQANRRHWGRVNLLMQGVSPLDIFRVRDDARVHEAVRRDLERRSRAENRQRGEGYEPLTDKYPWEYEIDGVYAEQSQRVAPLIITGRVA